MDKEEEKKLIIKPIGSIRVNDANLNYIAKTGIVNGSLWLEMERILKEYAQQVKVEQLKEAFDQGYDHHLDPNKYCDFNEWQKQPKCTHCGSSNIGAWRPDADKCFDCEMTWKV